MKIPKMIGLTRITEFIIFMILAVSVAASSVQAKVSAEEAERLKNDLTPFGSIRAGNEDGSIPAWAGGYTTQIPGDEPGGRRGDPFADEKALVMIDAKNMDQYADLLTDGTKALMEKYPDTYRVDVYPTHRTATAPQWVYDNTFKNATSAWLEGDVVRGAYGGTPFPIPQSAEEVMWNHLLRWAGTRTINDTNWYQLLEGGRAVMVTDGPIHEQRPYYDPDGSLEAFEKKYNGAYYQGLIRNVGPPIRAGEALLAYQYADPKNDQTWVYLQGQRRVRKLPNACCDTPTPAAAGVMFFDELNCWVGRMSRFDWKLVGKKEMFIPYNTNHLFQAKSDKEALQGSHLNPDYVRWEKHRVWVVEATLRKGERHQCAKSKYYCDEDTGLCALADRWDSNGELWRTLWSLSFVAPDLPGNFIGAFGLNDLLAGTGFVGQLSCEKDEQLSVKENLSDSELSPDAMVSGSIR